MIRSRCVACKSFLVSQEKAGGRVVNCPSCEPGLAVPEILEVARPARKPPLLWAAWLGLFIPVFTFAIMVMTQPRGVSAACFMIFMMVAGVLGLRSSLYGWHAGKSNGSLALLVAFLGLLLNILMGLAGLLGLMLMLAGPLPRC